MPLYTLTYFGAAGNVARTVAATFDSDDAAIEAMAECAHPYSADTHSGDRRVAHCPSSLLVAFDARPSARKAEDNHESRTTPA
jgi:hypothetical protein